MFWRPDLEAGQIWAGELCTLRAQRIVDSHGYVFIIRIAPPDWTDRTYKNDVARLVRSQLKFGDTKYLAADIIDNMHWLHRSPMIRTQWSFNLWGTGRKKILYKKLVYTWR